MRAALAFLLALASAPLAARDVVDATPPEKVAVTIYRDPQGSGFNRNYPRGFAMISETRKVTLPPGESTIRFAGVAEGMIGVSAIVTGLPGGTIEKNRNSALLSPAALVDGTLGNRVTLTRTDPATGRESSEQAVVRARADGGIVLQTSQGYEAVRCSGLPERLGFDRVPEGLSAEPVFTIDTRDEAGGTYTVTLTYLAWGFDWQAHYVASLRDDAPRGRRDMRMLSWLTLVNDNGQSFENAELMVVAGTLNIESDFETLASPPQGEPLQLECWPMGSTAAGSYPDFIPIPVPAPPPPMSAAPIMVTAARMQEADGAYAVEMAMLVGEENLGDLKLYRVPEPISVRAKGFKQVAFLQKDQVRGALIYRARCSLDRPFDDRAAFSPAGLLFRTENKEQSGLGVALPRGGVTVFEPAAAGELLIGEDSLRDYAVGEKVEIGLGASTAVYHQCAFSAADPVPDAERKAWREVRAVLTNAGAENASVELEIGPAAAWQVKPVRGLALRDGQQVISVSVKPGQTAELRFQVRPVT
ncbi:MAG: DUF4139 domain-containing protein [Erythrobacter sp.]